MGELQFDVVNSLPLNPPTGMPACILLFINHNMSSNSQQCLNIFKRAGDTLMLAVAGLSLACIITGKMTAGFVLQASPQHLVKLPILKIEQTALLFMAAGHMPRLISWRHI